MVGGGVPPSTYDGNPLPVNLQGELGAGTSLGSKNYD